MVFDTTRGLGTLPTPQLVRSTVLLHACASHAVVLAGCALLRAAVQRPDGLGRPALLAARHTFFRQFVAGERLADVKTVAARLRTSGVRCIVDHSTEELEHAEVRLSPAAATAHTRARAQVPTPIPSSSQARRDNLHTKLKLLGRLREEVCRLPPHSAPTLHPLLCLCRRRRRRRRRLSWYLHTHMHESCALVSPRTHHPSRCARAAPSCPSSRRPSRRPRLGLGLGSGLGLGLGLGLRLGSGSGSGSGLG